MKRRYWIMVDGAKVYRDTKAEITRLARQWANRLGRVIQVGYDNVPAGRQVMRANPAKGRPYYMLYQRYQGGKWGPEFGDFDRSAVDYERQDMREGHQAIRAADMKIVRFDTEPTQAQVMARARELGADYSRTIKTRENPVDMFIPAYADAKEKARRARLDYLARTKPRRLALSRRERPRSAAAEAKAVKTGKFVIRATGGPKSGLWGPTLTLYRPSRAAAEALGAGLAASGYKVTVSPA